MSVINELLFEQVKAGDVYAFEILFTKYYRQLSKYGCTYVDREVAEEIAADVLQKIWERRLSTDISTSLESYLFCTVRNQAFNYLRDQRRSKTEIVLMPDKIQDLEEQEQYDPYRQLSVKEQEQELAQQSEQLEEWLRYLSFPHKEIFELRKKGLMHKEIARELNLPEKTVRNSMERTIRKFRNLVKTLRPFGDYMKGLHMEN
jgi:RNA polymerase sigma-70 factor, ECF subfamily